MMSGEYEGAIELAWDGDAPSAEVQAKVVTDIRTRLGGLYKPSDLIFHTVWLTDDDEGPSVFVYGKEGSDKFHCDYLPVTEWSEGNA